MSDTNDAPPIVADRSPARDQAESAVRSVLLAISVVTAVAGFVSKHDLAGFVTYMQSSDFLAALAALIGAATFVWGQWKARHRSKQLAAIAADPRVPDAVATIKP
uniref:hypothetical protein n=1 Tax=uncultured Sphingomonas sp. TaxID=158754 RepID=UPI0035CA0529